MVSFASIRLLAGTLTARNSLQFSRHYSAGKTAKGNWGLVECVALTNDGSTFVAWHPKPEFPYEMSRPIPHVEQRDRSAVIKESAITTAMQAFNTKHPEIVRQELSKITFTTRHRWFPRARDKKAKKTPMDRPYL